MDADQSIKEYRADVIRKLNRDKLASPELEAELIELCEIGWHIKNTLPELAKDCSYIGLITRTYAECSDSDCAPYIVGVLREYGFCGDASDRDGEC